MPYYPPPSNLQLDNPFKAIEIRRQSQQEQKQHQLKLERIQELFVKGQDICLPRDTSPQQLKTITTEVANQLKEGPIGEVQELRKIQDQAIKKFGREEGLNRVAQELRQHPEYHSQSYGTVTPAGVHLDSLGEIVDKYVAQAAALPPATNTKPKTIVPEEAIPELTKEAQELAVYMVLQNQCTY